MPLTQTTLPDFHQHQTVLTRAGSAVVALVLLWDFRHRSRQRLALLGDHHLRDIGLDPLTVAAETTKPFWRD